MRYIPIRTLICMVVSLLAISCSSDIDAVEKKTTTCSELHKVTAKLQEGDIIVSIDDFACSSCVKEITKLSKLTVTHLKVAFVVSNGMYDQVSAQTTSTTIIYRTETATIQRCASCNSSICVFLFKDGTFKLMDDVDPSNVTLVRTKVEDYLRSQEASNGSGQ